VPHSLVVLAYTGGLRSTHRLAGLVAGGAEVATLTLDLGQGGDLADVRAGALAHGARRAHVVDAREGFAHDTLLPSLAGGARVRGHAPGPQLLALPLVARHLAHLARVEGATQVAHGCEGADAGRLEAHLRSVDRRVAVMLPAPGVAESRADASDGADGPRDRDGDRGGRREGDQVEVDANLWGRTVVAAGLGDTWQEPVEELFTLSEAPAAASDLPAFVEVDFERGVPTGVNGVAMSFVDLVTSLETIAGDHGVGRLDLIEPAGHDACRRMVVEAPAAVVLETACRAIEALVYDDTLGRVAREVGEAYGTLLDAGGWFSDTRQALDAFVARARQDLNGQVRLRLFKGECRVVGRRSDASRSAREQPR
jgi:argininosuccinate synthase